MPTVVKCNVASVPFPTFWSSERGEEFLCPWCLDLQFLLSPRFHLPFVYMFRRFTMGRNAKPPNSNGLEILRRNFSYDDATYHCWVPKSIVSALRKFTQETVEDNMQFHVRPSYIVDMQCSLILMEKRSKCSLFALSVCWICTFLMCLLTLLDHLLLVLFLEFVIPRRRVNWLALTRYAFVILTSP